MLATLLLPVVLFPPRFGLGGEKPEGAEPDSYEQATSVVRQPVAELLRNLPELEGLQPTKSQEDLPRILRKVGESVNAFFRNFPNTASVEEVLQERLQPNGKIRASVEQTFEYLCLVKTESQDVNFDEHRTRLRGPQPGHDLGEGLMLTSGFTSASLPFHSLYQGESAFRYLGTQVINGSNAFVIAYAQRPEVAKLGGAFRAGQLWAKTLSQGLAWVDSTTYQIVRMHTDLLIPLPKVRLERETTDIQFSEVRFKQVPAGLWLPREVAVRVEWAGRILRNRHSYSDFRVFNVEANEIIKGANPRE